MALPSGFQMAGTFDRYFAIIVPNLKICPKETFEIGVDEINDPIFKALIKFKYLPSIKIIRSKENSNHKFSFETISYKEILKGIKNLYI